MTVCVRPALGHVDVKRPLFDTTGKTLVECGVTAPAEIKHNLLTLFRQILGQDIDRRITAAELRWLRAFVNLYPPDGGDGDAVTQHLAEQCSIAGNSVKLNSKIGAGMAGAPATNVKAVAGLFPNKILASET